MVTSPSLDSAHRPVLSVTSSQLSTLDVTDVMHRLASQIGEHWLRNPASDLLVGIQTGGATVAQEIHNRLVSTHQLSTPFSHLDINLYRDDFDSQGLLPGVPTHLPEALDDRRILIIDDVLFTGRSMRAAINILFDYGRPQSVDLAVLIDRGGRELPIQPAFVGIATELASKTRVKMQATPPYALTVMDEQPPNRHW